MNLLRQFSDIFYPSKENESYPVSVGCRRGSIEPLGSWWIFNAAGPLLSCNVDIGEKSSITSKIIPSSVKRYYSRLTTILISCWSLEAEGKVLKKSGHCHRKTCPKKQFVQFLFFIYHNWSSLIKLLQPFISDTKEVQLHPSKIRGYPLSPLKCCPSILYCLLLKILLQQTLLFILQHNVFIAMFIGRNDERTE